MNNLLQYLAESSLALLLFYVLYALLLSRQTCFGFNRFYLLAALLLSLVIPFLELPAWPTEASMPGVATIVVQVQPAGESYTTLMVAPSPPATKAVNYWIWLYGIYVGGVMVAVIFFCCQFLKLYTLIYSHAADGFYWQRIKIIPTHGQMSTFSFLHYILFDNSQPYTPAERELILRHEQAHLAQKHTFDILYLKMLTIFFWFNPLLYLYKKALETTHEYLADAKVLQQEKPDTYAALLVQQVLNKTGLSFGNFFHLNQSLTLKRLAMMKKITNSSSLMRPLLVMPVVCAFAIIFASNRPVSVPDLMPDASNISRTTGNSGFSNKNNLTQAVSYASVSEDEISEPSFPDGKEQLYRFLLQNLRFKPEAFGKDDIRVTVVSIKLDEKGNPEIASAKNGDLIIQEINRVISLMPRWIPAYRAGKGLASRYELHFLINRKFKHSDIALNKIAKKGSLNSEGVPTFSSDIVHLGLNPETGLPKNFLNKEAIVVGNITEPSFPGGKAAMERYFRKNLNLGKVIGKELDNTIEFELGNAFALEIDQNGNIKKLLLKDNSLVELGQNPSPHQSSLKKVGNNFYNEVIRLINNMPQWKPAIKDGQPISARVGVSFGLLHTPEPAKSSKRNEIYSTNHEGKITFHTDRIVFWIPLNENSKSETDKVNQSSPGLKLPQFPGGKKELKEYLSSHTNYPGTAIKNKISGQAIIQATIDADGKVTNFKTLHTDNAFFEQEAFSVLREMPRWEPALKDGQRTSFNLVFPFVFALESKQNIPALRLPNNRNQLYVQDAITIIGYSQVIAGKTFVKKSVTPANHTPKPAITAPAQDKIFTFVEQNAQFPGGETEMNKFIKANLKYPAEALRNRVEGLVVVQFIVSTNGKISDVQVVKKLGAGTDEEAVRVVNKMPNFKPARQNGKPVNFRYTLPLGFGLTSSTPSPTSNASSGPDMPDKIFTFVEQMPVFRGGENELNKFIQSNIKYPAEAQQKGLTGLVVAQFTVDKTGKVSDPQVVKSLGAGTDEEAIRLIKLMPAFSPAKQNGQPVNFRYTLPIRFGGSGEKAMLNNTTPETIIQAPTKANNKIVEVRKPEYPGGDSELNRFLQRNIKYPAAALRAEITGSAIIQVTINKWGKPENFEVLHATHKYFEQEVLQVLNKMPDWQPARADGQPETTVYVFPFLFQLEGHDNKQLRADFDRAAQSQVVSKTNNIMFKAPEVVVTGYVPIQKK